jgi:hypothetical protein
MTRLKVDRLVLKTMPLGSPKARISGGNAACLTQRVEDNAFHLSTGGDKFRRLLAARFHSGDFREIGRKFVGGKRLDVHFY